MMPRRRAYAALPLAALAALPLAALAALPLAALATLPMAALAAGKTPAAAAAPCGTLVIPSAIGQDNPSPVTSLNPLIGDSIFNQQSAMLLYRPLVWVGQDGTPDPDRSLAQNIASLDHDTRFVVTLKPWRWSDGVPVTADDVVYTWGLIGELGPAFAYNGQGGMPGRVAYVRALDAGHVEFQMRAPTNPQWFELAALSFMPALPRHAWGQLSRDALWQRQTDTSLFQVVDGPFKLESFLPDRAISYVPNPLYGGHQAGVARLVIDFLEGGSALHAFRAGDVDMAQVPLALWDRERNLPGAVPVDLPEPFGYLSLIFNLRRDSVAFFRDARVRRALTDATDQQTMIDVVYRGASSENRVPVPTTPPVFRSPAVRAGTLPVRYDPDLARAELDAAGWLEGPDGFRARDGVRLAFTILFSSDSPERTQLLQILQQNLRAVGVDIRIQPVGFNQLLATSGGPSNGWDTLLLSETLTGVPDGTTYFDTDGTNNSGGYSNPRMDALIRQGTETAGLGPLYAYQDLFAAEQPVNILPQGAVRLLVSGRVRGMADFVNSQGFWSPEYLSLADTSCP
jgi:peptide/nickel transport system substrate-binding protein